MAAQLTTETLRLAFAASFRAVVEAVVGHALATREAPAPSGAGWSTPIGVSGPLEGTITAWVDDAGVSALARVMMRIEEAPEPSVAADMLRQLWAQATAATTLQAGFEGLVLEAGSTTPGPCPADGAGLVLIDGASPIATLWTGGTVTNGRAAAPSHEGAPGRSAGYPGNLAALLDIDLPIVVRFARTEMSLRSLAQLGPGSMVDMGRSPDAPVQLLVGGQIIAEGEVVVVGGNYGVRITSLVSPAERLKAMDL